MGQIRLNGVRVTGVSGVRSSTSTKANLQAILLDHFVEAVSTYRCEPEEAKHALNDSPQIPPTTLGKTLTNVFDERDNPLFLLGLPLSAVFALIERVPTETQDGAKPF